MLGPSDFKPAQEAGIDRLYMFNETMLVAPKGFGKCVVGFTALQDLIEDKVLTRVLVLSTAQVCNQVWAKEAAKWSHLNVKHVCITGKTPAQRISLLEEMTPIVICNFENVAWLVERWDALKFDGILVDEITKLKSVGGVGFKRLRYKLQHLKWRVGMTADPVAQESTEIYGQMLIIDLGKRLGRNGDNFKKKYFMSMDFQRRKWEIQPGGLTRLTNVLSDVFYTVDSEEYLAGIPPIVDHEILVKFSAPVRKLYETFVAKKIATVNGVEVVAKNAAVLRGKIHQLCCGTVYFTPELGEGGNAPQKIQLEVHRLKMHALEALLGTINTPVLVVYQYDFQREQIALEYGFPVFKAGNGVDVNDRMLSDWENGDLDGMLVHAKSAGHGLNLQYGPGHTLICMTYLSSADEWDQIGGRLARRGQSAKVVDRYTIVCQNTIEDCVMKVAIDTRVDLSAEFHNYLNHKKG